MKRTTLLSGSVFAILAAVSALPGVANAKSHPTLTVPSCLMTTNDGTTIVADWSNVPDATKYSVEFVGVYTDPVAMVTVTQDFDYDTVAPALGHPDSQRARCGLHDRRIVWRHHHLSAQPGLAERPCQRPQSAGAWRIAKQPIHRFCRCHNRRGSRRDRQRAGRMHTDLTIAAGEAIVPE